MGSFDCRWTLVVVLALLLTLSCDKSVDDMERAEVDFSSPKRVLSSVFFAAKTGQSAHLSSLCDPRGKANRHALKICGQDSSSPAWAGFVRQFETARLIGEARISGDRALVNFSFGPEGHEQETMELIRRDGRWFLFSY